MAKPLTKSRFKLALECPTKLYFSNPGNGYFDKNINNDFLQALADGGIQVGELAKFKYHDDPIGSRITIDTLDYAEAKQLTAEHLKKPGKVVIAEAALAHEDYFVRVDILIRHEQSQVIEIIEVKSKSVNQDVINSGFEKDRTKWLPYLYDIAFQAEVAERAFPGYKIVPKLLLLDSEQLSDIDGLHQHFKIAYKYDNNSDRKRVFIETAPALKKEQLGKLSILREVDVTDVIAQLKIAKVESPHAPEEFTSDLPSFMGWVSKLQKDGKHYFGGVSKTCKSCQFRADSSEVKHSGLHACWQQHFNLGLINQDKPLSIDLWGGGFGSKSVAQLVLDKNRIFLTDILAEDIQPAANKKDSGLGMSAFERRMAQIDAASGKIKPFLLHEERLADMDSWAWPLHMIDFETSAPAIPFFKDMHAYQTLAFQFSHHVMEKDALGKVHIHHATQWISTEANSFPSIEFVRQLKKALMPDGELKGTVFRYHNHENTVLRKLKRTIENACREDVPDAEDLMVFIDLITIAKVSQDEPAHTGGRPMVDLHRLVQEGYYSRHAGGSISLKYILPAILHDAPDIANVYSAPNLYGVNKKIGSLNFNDPNGHIWLQPNKEYDPYKTLPPIFGPEYGDINEMLLRLAGEDEEDGSINQGGLAMTAYNYTQFSCLNNKDRKHIEEALLRYCELDTLAMVILVQGLMELRGMPLTLA